MLHTWDLVQGEYGVLQVLTNVGARRMTAFALNGNTYVAVAVWRVQNATTGAFSYSSNSIIYRYDQQQLVFVPVQYVPTTAATDCAVTTIGNSTFLLFTSFRTDDGLYDIISTLLEFRKESV